MFTEIILFCELIRFYNFTRGFWNNMHCNKTTLTCIYVKLILNTFLSWLNFEAKYVLNLKLDKSRFVDKRMTGIQVKS